MSDYNQTIMGIDLGTQSIKVIIYCPATHELIASSSEKLELISKPDGSKEQLAHWWVDGFKTCLSTLDSDLKKSVVAVGVSGQQHGFVPLNEKGEVLAPVKLWCDTATEVECNEIMDSVGGKQTTIEVAGNPIAVGFTASKILWLKKNDPLNYTNMTTVLLPHDYLNFYLTGNRTMECGDASGTGLFNIKNRTWSDKIMAALDKERDLKACFPNLINGDDIAGHIKDEIADELGFSKGVIVSAGGGDNMMAAIGTGNVECGKLTASLGSSGTLYAYHDKPAIDPRGDLASFCSSTGGWLPLLCTMNCTIATELIRDLINVGLDKMETIASDIPPGAEGVITVPFFNGERTPNLPMAKASIFGLDSHNTTDAHLIRSTMEAAIFNLKSGLAAFKRCGMDFDVVTLTGGGSKSALWRQICADILNLPVKVLNCEENAAFGAMLQAHWAYDKYIGTPSSILDLCNEHLSEDTNKASLPNIKTVQQYEKIYTNYQEFTNLITKHYH